MMVCKSFKINEIERRNCIVVVKTDCQLETDILAKKLVDYVKRRLGDQYKTFNKAIIKNHHCDFINDTKFVGVLKQLSNKSFCCRDDIQNILDGKS